MSSPHAEDMSITLLAIQLLEKPAMKPPCAARSITPRASSNTFALFGQREIPSRLSQQWTAEKKRDESSLLLLRGRLESKLHDGATARKDFEASFTLVPTSSAAEKTR